MKTWGNNLFLCQFKRALSVFQWNLIRKMPMSWSHIRLNNGRRIIVGCGYSPAGVWRQRLNSHLTCTCRPLEVLLTVTVGALRKPGEERLIRMCEARTKSNGFSWTRTSCFWRCDPTASRVRSKMQTFHLICLAHRSRCPGGSTRRPARLRCWSAGSCDPASWPPLLWPPRRSSEPAAAPWRCSTSSVPLAPAGGCTKPAAPRLWGKQTP